MNGFRERAASLIMRDYYNESLSIFVPLKATSRLIIREGKFIVKHFKVNKRYYIKIKVKNLKVTRSLPLSYKFRRINIFCF